ncbi:hypothetical protein R1sor_020774 [Riccia sorocarpa]|uniref:Molybdate transporter 2 n=1 Tax=Riccia sorocarpa TaxID=122646 RepID=A0ABD3GF52_9MARC
MSSSSTGRSIGLSLKEHSNLMTVSDTHENAFQRQEQTQEFRRFRSLNDQIFRSLSSKETTPKDEQVVEISPAECSSPQEEPRPPWYHSVWSYMKTGFNRRTLQEVSGAFGGLGSFLPAVLALSLHNGLDLGTTLLFTGVFNLLTGLVFRIPIPVQPMGAILVAALSPNPLTLPQIMAAGLITGFALGILGLTGLMDYLYRLIPLPVVRGVMLAEGLITAVTAVTYIFEYQDSATMRALRQRDWFGIEGLIMPIIILILVGIASGLRQSSEEGSMSVGEEDDNSVKEPLLSSESISRYQESEEAENPTRLNWRNAILNVPAALLIFLIGLSLAIAYDPTTVRNLQLGPSAIKFVEISSEDWNIGFLRAAVYQIPFSILGSVISTSKLSSDYFPGERVSPSSLCLSVWMMNLLGCWLGAVPVCHGAVGLAGQYKFGARSGVSMVILGVLKVLLGLLLGSSVSWIFGQYPVTLFGVLLLWSGLELAIVSSQDQTTPLDLLVVLAVAAVSIGSSTAYSTSIGFLCGLLLYFVLKAHQWLKHEP